MDDTKEVRQIPVVDIIPNRFQPRISFDEKALSELSESIKQHGIIQPLVVRPLGDKFEIIAGERRYKAATMAGLSTVPAIVTEMDDSTSAEVALIENVQRKDLTAIEEAKSYKNMLDRGNLTQEELAKKMGLSQSTIANKLRLLNLCDEVQDALLNEKISERHARALLAVPDKNEQVNWLNRIINERLTVRQLDLAIKDEQNEKNSQVQSENDIPIVNINPDIDSIISNSTDINAAQPAPEVNVFDGINNLAAAPTEITEPVTGTPEQVQENLTEEKPEVPNKFFNFLEDEAANMTMDETPVQNIETNQQIEAPSQSEEIFNFAPEYTDNQQVQIVEPINNDAQFEEFNNQTQTENIDTLEVLDSEPVQPEIYNQEEIINPEYNVEQPVEVQPEIINQVENPIDSVEPIEQEPQVQQYFENPVVTVDTYNVPEAQNNDYISVSDAINNDEILNNDNNIAEQNIEPIPVVEGDNILDPVKLFDTLEPDFYEKVKESVGVDLKTAINKYRDLTTDLINRGFNINLEEIDADNKYRIEIEINKE